MAKPKNTAKPLYDSTQHTSTSEAVKKRPRKRATGTAAIAKQPRIPKIEEKENVPIVPRPLSIFHLDELYKIWDADKRIPTVESRRAWAAARNLASQDVHRFFSRHKALLKKARQILPTGTYILPVGTPPVIKQEEEIPPPKERKRKVTRSTVKAEHWGVHIKSDPPTSDTFVASPLPDKKNILRFSSPLPPSSPSVPSSPALESNTHPMLVFPSSPTVAATTDTSLWCCQGLVMDPPSSFTCVLCTPGFTIFRNLPRHTDT
ncbi:hypothetical protein C0991_007505 [Blastosporella zonata]|nr:hypothetical protein C0991_007505 [Blastosporella zonata]